MRKLLVANLLLILMTLLARSGDCLKCYVCRSDETSDCETPEDESLAKECDPKEGRTTYCRKISQKLKFKSDSNFTAIRSCAYGKGKYDCYNFKWLDLAYQTTCECDTDLCNRGHGPAPRGLVPFLAASALARLHLR